MGCKLCATSNPKGLKHDTSCQARHNANKPQGTKLRKFGRKRAPNKGTNPNTGRTYKPAKPILGTAKIAPAAPKPSQPVAGQATSDGTAQRVADQATAAGTTKPVAGEAMSAGTVVFIILIVVLALAIIGAL